MDNKRKLCISHMPHIMKEIVKTIASVNHVFIISLLPLILSLTLNINFANISNEFYPSIKG